MTRRTLRTNRSSLIDGEGTDCLTPPLRFGEGVRGGVFHSAGASTAMCGKCRYSSLKSSP
jgi:hypothetical protein